MIEELKLTNLGVEVQIYKQTHKFIMGKDGANINFKDETNTKIYLPAELVESNVIAIRGPKENVMKEKERLLEILNDKLLLRHTADIKANAEHKSLIGKNEASIKKICDKIGASIVFRMKIMIKYNHHHC
ncbi:vigilin [Nephila pilipes]|uniref:Vigilin n=1 Tax=Nephila pilipes TaxID=299642 RepID=A0A8X6U6Z4_NEPPI|nr:vigilin [Nephila pilipes]